MKKLVRNLFAVIAATALVGSLASCADSDAEDPFATTSTNANTGSGTAGGNGGAGNGGGDNGNQGVQGAGQAKYTNNEITFPVTVASTNDEDTVLLIKYDRTAAGADELIKITKAGLKVWKNGTEIKTFDTIKFALDEYGATFDDSDKDPIKNDNNKKEYKVKLSIGTTVAAGDSIKIKLDEKAFIEAIGKDAANVKPESVVVALIDKAESAGYYKELCENSNLYKPFFTKNEEAVAPQGGNAGQEQGNTGAGNAGQEQGNTGAGNGGQEQGNTGAGNGGQEQGNTGASNGGQAAAADNTIWSGSKVLGWGESDGIVLAGTTFENKNFTGLKVTCAATNGGFKIATNSPWAEIAFENIVGCNSDEDKKAVYPSTDGDCVVTLTIPAANIANMKTGGIKIMGDTGITIKKVELIATSTTPAADNTIWSGSKVLGWGESDGIVLAGTTFENKNFTGLKVTCAATNGGFKIATNNPWAEIAFENIIGCNSDEDKKAVYPSTDGDCVVTLTIPTANIANMKTGGIKIMGDTGITIKKVELVTQ